MTDAESLLVELRREIRAALDAGMSFEVALAESSMLASHRDAARVLWAGAVNAVARGGAAVSANRYEWLRNNSALSTVAFLVSLSPTEFDAAIDKARGAT